MSSPDRLDPYAVRVCLAATSPASLRRPQELVAVLLEEIGRRCLAAGASVIGHVKCHVRAEPEGRFHANLTSMRSGASWAGNPPASASRLEVELAVLVYGLEKGRIAEAVTGALTTVAEPVGVSWALHPVCSEPDGHEHHQEHHHESDDEHHDHHHQADSP